MHSSKWPRYGGPFGYALTRSGRPGRGSSMRAPQFQLMPCGARHSTRDTQPRAGAPRCQSCKGVARFWRRPKCALMPHKIQISAPEIRRAPPVVGAGCKGVARFWRGLKCALMPHKRSISAPEIWRHCRVHSLEWPRNGGPFG